MQEQKNKLFAIITNTLSDPNSGKTTGHTLGGIFDVNDDGIATDCTAIDFDGAKIRRWPFNKFGNPHAPDVSHIPAERALFIPITNESAELLKEAMEVLASEIRAGENPFYRRAAGAALRDKYESHYRAPVTFDGNPLPLTHEEQMKYRPANYSRQRASIGCRDFLLNLMQQVAGIPIDDLSLEDRELPKGRMKASEAMGKYIEFCAGNEGATYQTRNSGRLLNLGSGRYAYALDDATGWITHSLNSLKHITYDGHTMPLAKFLIEHSAPFYDPTLNENNLGRGASMGHAQPSMSR